MTDFLSRHGPPRGRHGPPSRAEHRALENYLNMPAAGGRRPRRGPRERLWRAALAAGGGVTRRLTVPGDLVLCAEHDADALPPGLTVCGNLICEGMPRLRRLPRDLVVLGRTDVALCPRLRDVSRGARLYGGLRVGACGRLRRLPLAVAPSLHVEDCGALRRLYGSCAVAGDLRVMRCAAFEGFARPLEVHGDLVLVTEDPGVRESVGQVSVGGFVAVGDAEGFARVAGGRHRTRDGRGRR